jgi:hypothetical protein
MAPGREVLALPGGLPSEDNGEDMPPVSQKQRAAMGAAASGRSTLGIPKSVGKEFIKADKGGKLPRRARKRKG